MTICCSLKSLVHVELTEEGIAVLSSLGKQVSADKDHENWYEFTLGDLMRNFGNVTHADQATLFVRNEIYFPGS